MLMQKVMGKKNQKFSWKGPQRKHHLQKALVKGLKGKGSLVAHKQHSQRADHINRGFIHNQVFAR